MQLPLLRFGGLLLVVSMVSPKVVNRPRFSNYHLPWACSVVYKDGSLIGACAIFDEDKVLVSVDNFNEDVIVGNNETRKYYEVLDHVVVYAGSNLMDPEKLKPWATPDYQVQRASKLHVATGQKGNKFLVKSTPDLNLGTAEYDHYGVAFNVGFLVLSGPFNYTSHLQPIIIAAGSDKRTQAYIRRYEGISPVNYGSCVTYSWNSKRNRIRYHEVLYLPSSNCLDVFCMWKLSSCNLFPKQTYLTCFKSVTYVDVCPSARGAALFCPGFENSVFGILTTAPSCGQRNMPGVYTTMPKIINLYQDAFQTTFDANKRPKYEPLGQNQPYSPFG